MEKIIHLDDHRLLQLEARRDNLSYRDYRRKLDLLDIRVDEAVETIKEGRKVEDILRDRISTMRRSKRVIYAMIAASVAMLIYTIFNPSPSRYEQVREQYQKGEISEEQYKETEFETFGFSRT